LLGFGNSSISELEKVFREICEVAAGEDGLQFQADAVKGRAIREDNIYDGVRLNLKATLGKAVIPLQIDVGFGNAPVPAPTLIEYPATLDLPAAKLRAYQRETVIAEKFNAMVELGLRNTRLKDFYDLWALAGLCDFEGEVLAKAISATFAKRRPPLPPMAPVALTSEFAGEQVNWKPLKLLGLEFANSIMGCTGAPKAHGALRALRRSRPCVPSDAARLRGRATRDTCRPVAMRHGARGAAIS
jgi:hypothetical protein